MSIRRKLIKKRVNELLENSKITKPPVDVMAVARSLDLEVVLAPDDDGLSGFLISDHDAKKYIIGVNRSHHMNRKRFTIAHEIGHFVLKHPGGKLHIDSNSKLRVAARSSRSSQGTDPHEIEANIFAAELLMPEQFIDDAVDILEADGQIGDDDLVRSLARDFQVSTAAMSFRLANLDMIEA